MSNGILAADIIYNNSIQILAELEIEPQAIPLVMGAVTQRLDQFALSDMGRTIMEMREVTEHRHEQPAVQDTSDDESEVDNG